MTASTTAAESAKNGKAKKKEPGMYYDMATASYYAVNSRGEYQAYPLQQFKLLLRSKGSCMSDDFRDAMGLTLLEQELLRLTTEETVHFAGSLGGFQPGLYEMLGSRVLVTRGPRFIKPKEGRWDVFGVFLEQLFGEQKKYFLGWLKSALVSLRNGLPWSPGQLLAIAGPAGCGKSVLQSLLTDLLGGRMSTPYEFMTKGTPFNSDVFGAEHALIGDQNHKTDYPSRRNFGSAIKNLVVNPEQYVRGMFKTPVTLLPFLRVTLTLNDNPEALSVLPPLDSDVRDKVMLLKAGDGKIPVDTPEFPTFQSWKSHVQGEFPAFLHWLRSWKIPDAIKCKRYGVTSFHHADLIDAVHDLSPETRLWELLDTYLFKGDFVGEWVGSSSDLQALLEKETLGRETRTIFPRANSCGELLAKLAHRFQREAALLGRDWKPAVEKESIGGNRKRFIIRKDHILGAVHEP